jgi:putative ABC transport system ATP-binding protein
LNFENEHPTLTVVCKDLIKTYTAGNTVIRALNGVNLDVHLGELMILSGPSGCGKTTLISVIAGILNQDKGLCEVYGYDLLHLSEQEKLLFRATHVGFVFQQFNLIPTLTAAENVAVPLIINGADRIEATKKAADLLDHVGLHGRANSFPNQLSGGQQQRVAIARAIIHNPRLVVCDEPTSSLDGETGQKVMALLKELSMKGDRSLIVVTHDSRILKYADRIAKMEDGRIIDISYPTKMDINS